MKDWGADCEVSRPVVPADTAIIDFGGLGFGHNGLVWAIDQATAEAVFSPGYAPEDP